MIAPPVRKHFQFPLQAEPDGPDWIVGTPKSNYFFRGGIAAVALPPLFWLLMLLLYVGYAGGPNPELASELEVAGAALTALSFALGGALLIGAGPLSRRSRIRFDRAHRVVRRERDGLEIPWQAVALVRARASTPQIGGYVFATGLFGAIELIGHDGRVLLALHDKLASNHKDDIEALTSFITTILGEGSYRAGHAVAEDVDIGGLHSIKLGIDDARAAMLCYIPVYGVGLVASIYYLFAAKNRPFVRFAAIQSLAGMAAAFVIIGFAVAVGVVPLIALDVESEPAILAIVLGIAAIGLGNFIAFIVAAVRANKGRVWVFPWLGWIVKRWIPSSCPS